MKRISPAACAVLLLLISDLSTSLAQSPAPTAQRGHLDNAYGHLPLGFEANRGQTDERVRFVARGAGYAIFLTDDEAVLSLHKPAKTNPAASFDRLGVADFQPLSSDVVRMRLLGAARAQRVQGLDRLPGTVNYLAGDPASWRSNVPTYSRVKYAGIYPGVDLVYYGNQRRLEYDFVVAPHADPRSIALFFSGAKLVKLAAGGDLEISTPSGAMTLQKPVIYQIADNRREPVEGHFVLQAGNAVKFELGAYDHSKALVIDPVLAYSTFLGGTNSDWGVDIAVDSQGYAYVTGVADSGNFPVTPGAFMTRRPEPYPSTSAVFVSKINPKGTALVYSTFLGGGGGEAPGGIAVTAGGNAVVFGGTYSAKFPVTTGALDTKFPSSGVSAFITEFNTKGSALVYSTFIPAASVGGLAVDAAGNAYITGLAAWDFPTTAGVYQPTIPRGGGSAYVAKLNAAGSRLIYSTFVGSTIVTLGHYANSAGLAIALDSADNAYFAGLTYGDFPVTPGAFQTTYKAKTYAISFAAKLNSDATVLDYATYLGGSEYGDSDDTDIHIAVDKEKNAYVVGSTTVLDFPVTRNAFQPAKKGAPNQPGIYVAKLNAAGSELLAGTYLGGSSSNEPTGVATDSAGNIYVVGDTYSRDFPVTATALEPGGGGYHCGFISRLNSSGSALVYSTFFDGNYDTYMGGMAMDTKGSLYITGETFSTIFPITKGAFQTVNNDYPDGFVSKIAFVPGVIPTTTTLTSDDNPALSGAKVVFIAYVAAAEDAGPLTGTVKFAIDGGAAISVALDDTGHAYYAISTLKAGSHAVKATYSGNVDYAASSGAIKETIKAP